MALARMSISRAALALQMVVVLVPLTYLAVFGGVAILIEVPRDLRGSEAAYSAVLLHSWLALGCGWALATKFVARGRDGLRKFREIVVVGAASGIFPVAVGWVALSNGYAGAPWPSIFVVGTPAIVPLTHVVLEWRRAVR